MFYYIALWKYLYTCILYVLQGPYAWNVFALTGLPCLNMYWFIHLFVHSFICLFVHLFIHSFIHSFNRDLDVSGLATHCMDWVDLLYLPGLQLGTLKQTKCPHFATKLAHKCKFMGYIFSISKSPSMLLVCLKPIKSVLYLLFWNVCQGSCGHGKPGEVMEFEKSISRPGEVMEN